MAITRVTMRLQNEIDRLMRQITDRTQRELQAAWASAWDEVRADLVDAVAAALTSGTRVTITQMRTNRRLALVLQMVLARLQDLVTDTERAVFADLQGLVDAAVAAQGSIVDSQFPPGTDLTQIGRWSRVDIRQVDAMVVRTTRRIHSLNRPLPAQAVAGMKRELIRGISVGSNPRVTARRIVARAGDAGFGGGLVRAMTIARTETLDAYREATRVAQEPHADVLDGWQWLASLSPRTCPACLSMHGRSFPLTEPGPNGHQNCRCTRIPKLASWADLGLDGVEEPEDLLPDADAYFDSLTPDQQRALLGPRGYQAWLAGDWDRDQWAVKRENAGWRDSWVNAKPPADAGAGGGGKPPTDPHRGFGPPPDDGDRKYWDARQDALEGPGFASNGESLHPDELLFAERMVLDAKQKISWIPTGSNGNDESGTLPAADFVWVNSGGVDVEHKGFLQSTPIEPKYVIRQIRKALFKNERRDGIVERVLVDLGDRPIPPGLLDDLADKYRSHPMLSQLWIMSRDLIREVPLK